MARVTTANRCAQALTVKVADRPATVVCTKAENHKGEHSAPLKWEGRGPAMR